MAAESVHDLYRFITRTDLSKLSERYAVERFGGTSEDSRLEYDWLHFIERELDGDK